MFLFISFYLGTLFIFAGSGCTLLTLIFVEILSWIFVVLVPTQLGVSYLLIQSVFFLVGIIGAIWSEILLVTSLLMKLGLPPFHLWLARMALMQDRASFLFMLTMHKLFPILFLVKLGGFWFNYVLILVMSCYLVTTMLLLSSLFVVLIYSSLLHSMWMLLSSVLGLSGLLLYWMLYSLASTGIFFSLNSEMVKMSDQTSITNWSWLLMSGIPPFIVFWLKAHVMYGLLGCTSWGFLLSISLVSMILMSTYYRVWHFSNFFACSSLVYSSGMFLAPLSILGV